MNEQIRELWAQCVIKHSKTPMNWQDVADEFAELIAQECIDTLLKESKWYWDKDEFESSNAIQNAARRLKEHFGV